MFSYLIAGITFAFAAAVQPGPLQTYIISQTMKKGWRATLPAAFAPVLSDIPILALVLFLLSAMPDTFIIILRLAGGLFLLYLAYSAFKTWRQFDADKTAADESGRQTLFKAVFVNLLNPAPYLGWSLIMGPIFLKGWNIAPSNGIALIAGFYVTMVLTLIGLIMLFGFARRLGPQVSKIMIGLSALLLLAFGLYQLWVGVNSLFSLF